ncbi:hypothetical protein ATO13_12421 [Stappia sp. 22II-S9-Z10]|nr:hypothetical protein ATO13_12421 [Stappia sp. 22II-S9-Z10]
MAAPPRPDTSPRQTASPHGSASPAPGTGTAGGATQARGTATATAGDNAAAGTAGVIAPPPLILAATLGAGLGLDHAAGLAFQGAAAARLAAGGALAAAAIVLGIAALWRFLRTGTAVEPWHPTTALITDGIFAYTRNPIYLAFFLVQAGAGIAFGGPLTLALLVPLAAAIHLGVVRREERYLGRLFGAAYADYRRRVRRYL